jgi:peptide/nickel transport system substrate-binding protein
MTARPSTLDRRALFSSAAAATLLAASGVSAAGLPRKGGRLRMALSGAGRSDTWHGHAGLFMQVATQGLAFDTLTEVAADGTLQGELALSWQGSRDGRTWEFTLRNDVEFHDGMPMTARDVVASLQKWLKGDVQAQGTHQIQIKLDTPDAGLPLTLSQPEFVIRAEHAPLSGNGTGLYRVIHFAAGQQLLSRRVKDHYKGDTAGWFDEVELVSIPSETIRAEALGSYMVDAANISDARDLIAMPDIVLLPHSNQYTQAVSRDLIQPMQIGSRAPMDNLRAAERWWFA